MRKIFAIAGIILSCALAVGTATVFKACGPKDDGTWMHCHTVQNAVVVLGICMAAVFAVVLFSRIKPLNVSLSAVEAIGSVVTFLLPGTLMSMCMMDTMRCYTYMQPFVRVVSVLILAVSVATLAESLKKA